MSDVLVPIRPPAVRPLRDPRGREPRRVRFTVEKFWRLFETGIFDDRRVELIDGEIYDMPAQEEPHVTGILKSQAQLNRVFGFEKGFVVRCQATLSFAALRSLPDPDLAVVVGSLDDRVDRGNPTTAVLIVEVANTTIRTDRGRKARLYAAAGIADYWILNVPARQMEIHRDPRPDSASKTGYSYGSVVWLKETERVAPLAKPDASILVGDCLPRPLPPSSDAAAT